MSRFHLDDEQIRFFDENGYLILREWIRGRLLDDMRTAGDRWIADGMDREPGEDYNFANRESGRVFFRVNYVHDKGDPASLALLGSPQVLAVAESLCGRNMVPTYESMVFKQAGDGEAIRWHQDAVHPRRYRIFNYDLYLDASKVGAGALKVIPRSQTAQMDFCAMEQAYGWDHPGAIDVEMEPGDVLLHDVMVVHGSARAIGKNLRRTVYYEFRSAEQILEEGPWDRSWIDKRMRLIPLGLREHAIGFPDAPQYEWQPDEEFRQPLAPDADLKVTHVVHTAGAFCSATSVM